MNDNGELGTSCGRGGPVSVPRTRGRFSVGDADYDAASGTLVMVPPGTPHTFANLTDQPAVMLSSFTPDLYVQYFRELQEALAGGRPLTQQAHIDAMSRYATEPATDLA
ncbi:cupin domain-containing protein [Streptomyces sp. NPDC058247]|uniref:cupin domain-containing protein n=1 Tax=Streptomyces sp. NPDC058247 TaxID=3346401 RepID=UPI0036E5F4DF